MSDSSHPTSAFRTCAPDCRALFDAAGDAIFLLDGMQFVACNPSALVLYGCAEAEILGKTPWNFSPPRQADGSDSEATARAHIELAFAGTAQLFEWRHQRLDGGIFEAEIRLNLIERSDAPPLLQAMVRDITARKQAEAALRVSRDYAEQLLAVSGAMLLVLDREGRITRINPAGCAILRCKEADILGQDWIERFVPARARDEIRALFQRVLAGDLDSSLSYDNPVLTCSGEERHLTWHNTPLREVDGQVTGVLSSGLDISEQRRAETALVESESRIRAILDTAVDGVLVVDEASRVVFANPAISRLTGYSARELQDRPLTDLMPERYRGLHEAGFNRYLSSGQPSMPWRELAFVLLHRDGHEIPVEVSIGERGGAGQRQFIGVMRDVGERQRNQQALREREERINLLLDSMAEGIYGVDTRGNCTFVNPAGLRLLGYERAEDLLGRHIHEVIHHSHGDGSTYPARECRAYRAYAEDRGIHVDDEVFWRRDGTAFPVEYWSYPMRQDGQAIGSVVTFLDIGERRQGEERLYAARLMLQHVINTVPHFVFWKDRDSRYLGCNEAFARLGGMEPEELIGKSDDETPWRRHADLYRRGDQQVMETQTPRYNIVEPLVLESGVTAWVETSKVPLRDSQGQVIGVLGVFQDITARRKAEERLRQSAKVFESTTDGVSITDAAGNIIAINRAFTTITGYTEAETLGRNPRILKSGRHGKPFYQAVWNSIAQTGSWSGEIWNRRKNGEIYPEWLTISTVTDMAGKLTNYVGVFSDISQIKQSEAERERLAHFDPLTGLPNRLLFNARLDHAIQRAERDGTLLTLLFIDLDRFKTVNDALGHPAGDRVLQEVARRLQLSVRAEDTLARLGGDEFAIALEGEGSATQASAMAEKLLAALTQPFELDAQTVFVGASIGISTYPEDGKDAATLLKNADAAMHQSKDDGRDTYRFYNAAMTRSARERLTLETNLRRAIEQQEFLLYYQPQIDVGSGEIIGVEALVRWNHPASGLISPARFIPLAEETGLIVPLGEWVLFTACTQARAWLDDANMPKLSVAVNLSPRQFRQHNLAAHVRAVLDACGLPANLLELEITESAVMEHPDQASATLRALKELGITVSIDDFGTGYSSLAYLKRFPIDKLKIDQSFIREIPQDQSDMEIAATIIAMARNLHLKVLAEGVETEEQLAFLQIHGCDAYQGYLCSRPVPAAELVQWLAQRATDKT